MKKKILSGFFASAILIAAATGAMESRKSEAGLSDLAMANVEALATGESEGGKYYDCHQGTETSHGTREFWCGTCSVKNISKSGLTGGCKLN